MSINEVRYLPECGSTNAYVKEHFEEFGPVGAVYTENQTAGRGRLGRSWVNAEGKALYYTAAIREPLAQPATLPLRPFAQRQKDRGHPVRGRELRLPAAGPGHFVRHRHQSGPAAELL